MRLRREEAASLDGYEAEARYQDGLSARTRAVRARLETGSAAPCLALLDARGKALDRWPVAALSGRRGAEAGTLVLSPEPGADARLLLDDPPMARALGALRPGLTRRRAAPGQVARAGLWGAGALLSAWAIVFHLVPALAAQLAPLVPPERERALGDAVAMQMARLLGAAEEEGDDGLCRGEDGRAALATMAGRLEAAAELPYPVRVDVLDHGLVNAVALPGGRVMIFRGLIEKAESAEEVAGVLAHELGHVVHRDPTTGALRAAGTAGIFSMVLGDVLGVGIAAAAGEAAIEASYRREAEARADEEAIAILAETGLSAEPFAAFFERLRAEHGDTPALMRYFASHPALAERAERARAASEEDEAGGRVLSEAEWQALRGICG